VLFHPFEMVVQVLLQLLVTVIVLGLDPLAAALVGVVAAFHGVFQHWNVRTPRWLGYLIQRPESHCLHHERGVHARNYADFPLWDMLFGSFDNPRDFLRFAMTHQVPLTVFERSLRHQILFGSNYPRVEIKNMVSAVESLGFSEECQSLIFRENADSLLEVAR